MQAAQSRFTILGALGTGGMGVVHEAHDAVRGEVVAIKTLDHLDPWRLYCLKNEFRTLANVAHPNLVALHELLNDGERWILVLERVHGQTLETWLRTANGQIPTATTVMQIGAGAMVAQADGSAIAGGVSERLRTNSVLDDLDHIRSLFAAVTRGVSALHDAGILHRDLKPSNVMVEDGGRVAILDFGLAIDSERALQDDPYRRSGTRSYLAPERVRGEPAREESDWYSLGVMLYEVLTGLLPYTANANYRAWSDHELAPPHLLDVRVPVDLSLLAVRLLQAEPSLRPKATEILSQLGVEAPPRISSIEPKPSPNLWGRDIELAVLDAELALVSEGARRFVRVQGESGIGKTALLDAFSHRHASRGDVVLLRSRCLAGESSPYKGVDGLVDSLADYLLSNEHLVSKASEVSSMGALLAMFPVLRSVPTLESLASNAPSHSERVQRRRAIDALVGLLRAVAEARTLVLIVDDVQWGDADGAQIVAELLSSPQLARTLFVVASHPNVPEHAAAWARIDDATGCDTILLGPLARADCEHWVRAWTGDELHAQHVSAIVDTCSGFPMFLVQLLQAAREWPASSPASPDLQTLVQTRLEQLATTERDLVEVLALVARPLRLNSLRSIGIAGVEKSLPALQARRWLRASGPLATGRFEIAHNRLRTLIADALPTAGRRALHERISRGLEGDPSIDPELLSVHFEAAGLREEASVHAVRAGREALSQLAFSRAADMFERALELDLLTGARRRDVLLGLASACQGLGLGQRAGEDWSEVSALTEDRREAIEMERRAAEQWLTNGHIDRGLAVLERVVNTTGLRIPRTRPRALAELLYFQLRLRVMGPGSKEHPDERLRADALFAASRALSMLDAEFGLALQARYHFHASRSGDPERLALALAWSACFRGILKGPDDASFRTDIGKAERLGTRFEQGLVPGFCAMAHGAANVLSARYLVGIEKLDQAERLLDGKRGGGAWERMFTRVVMAAALAWSGQLRRLAHDMDTWLKDSDERGDGYTSTMLRLRAFNGIRYLARDDPDALLNEVECQLQRWPKHQMAEDLSRRYAGWLRACGALARGDALSAREHLVDVERGQLVARAMMPPALRAEVELLRGLVAVSLARPEYARLQRAIARMENDPRPYGAAFAWTLRAARALRLGQSADAELRRAESEAKRSGLLALAASAGLLRARRSSTSAESDGLAYLRAEGVVSPERFARFWLAPWTLDRR